MLFKEKYRGDDGPPYMRPEIALFPEHRPDSTMKYFFTFHFNNEISKPGHLVGQRQKPITLVSDPPTKLSVKKDQSETGQLLELLRLKAKSNQITYKKMCTGQR